MDRLVLFSAEDSRDSKPDWVKPGVEKLDFRKGFREMDQDDRKAAMKNRRKLERARTRELRQWWLNKMVKSPHPLQEKLTLFWHGHFATSIQKVKLTYAMYLQNQMFRDNANGNWKVLVKKISRDPAMLIYLDNAKSKKKAPNENYARELMELFTLGEGHYTEEDIQASARAFTGWSINRKKIAFQSRAQWHDKGEKSFMNQKGFFDGDDIVDIIFTKPQASSFIMKKIWEFFVYPDPDPRLVKFLGEQLTKNKFELKPMLQMIFRSAEFYSPRAMRTQVKSPVQWLIAFLKQTESSLPNSKISSRMLQSLGQVLLAPPNVKGWDGGVTWITTSSLLNRYNAASILVKGRPRAKNAVPALDTTVLISEEAYESATAIRAELQWRLFNSELRREDRAKFTDYINKVKTKKGWGDRQIKSIVQVMVSTPQYQLI